MKTSKMKVERVKLGMTQDELATRAGIPKYKLSFFESGVMKLKQTEIQRIEKILGTQFNNPDF